VGFNELIPVTIDNSLIQFKGLVLITDKNALKPKVLGGIIVNTLDLQLQSL